MKLIKQINEDIVTEAAEGPFKLPKLPFDLDALEPHISEETLKFHYKKHHQGYVNKLNDLVKGTRFEKKTLEEIIKSAKDAIFNNAAQVWNHTFYWNCMSPNGGGRPKNELAEAIDKAFGSFDKFKEEFAKTAGSTFGSGWVWLVATPKLKIVSTSNAGTPLTEENQTPLLVCDVWEHAYYIDRRNDRAKYVDHFWKVVDWDCVAANFKQENMKEE